MKTREVLKRCRRVALTVCVLCVMPQAHGQDAQSSTSSARRTLKEFLRQYLRESRPGADKATRFSAAFMRRGDGAVDQVVVYVTGRHWCGSGGCTLLVLEPHDSSFRLIGRTSIVRPPIRALRIVTNGRNDIGVWVQGGGIQPGYEAILEFDGRAYPGNPTVPPARRLPGRVAGEVLVPTTGNTQPLYSNRRPPGVPGDSPGSGREPLINNIGRTVGVMYGGGIGCGAHLRWRPRRVIRLMSHLTAFPSRRPVDESLHRITWGGIVRRRAGHGWHRVRENGSRERGKVVVTG